MTPEDIAYLKSKAQSAGYNPDDLLKVINYESSGRHGVWGGKGNQYFGLIQFGPNERKQFGVDTKNPTAMNQIDATMKYLAARGFKPGMGLLDLYSTVNAGSPGHYNRSDGNGTIASHVAKMSGQPLAYADADRAPPSSITDLIEMMSPGKQTPVAMPSMPAGLIGIRKAAADLNDEGQDEQDDAFQQAMLNFHNRNHAQALGLLGGE